MKKLILVLLAFLSLGAAAAQEAAGYPGNYAKEPRFKALLYYSDTAEPDHVIFAEQAYDFFWRLTWGEGFILDKTTSLKNFPYSRLKD